VTGCGALEIDVAAGSMKINNSVVQIGDLLTIDGATGRVIIGEAPMRRPDIQAAHLTHLLGWADHERKLAVRANADTPEDARRARAFGAQGIGLCRTEHMFFGEERLPIVRSMILAGNDEDRQKALCQLERFQQDDFIGIFEAMDGLPVTIRTLDPPLHEFLPSTKGEIRSLAKQLGQDWDVIDARISAMREQNPMLGLRGVRVGILWPEVTRMQARAILRAAAICQQRGIVAKPEIMIPLVSMAEELKRQKAIVAEAADEIFEETGVRVEYMLGTMIEVPRAALVADEIAEHAEFFSFGTNDLTQTALALSRDDAGSFLAKYIEEGVMPEDPFQTLDQEGVGQLVQIAVNRGRTQRSDIKLGICGEHGGDPKSIGFFHRIGLDYVSCSPFRLPVARLAAAHAALGQTEFDR
jgi:pyruvate,orthophosphate dikinase